MSTQQTTPQEHTAAPQQQQPQSKLSLLDQVTSVTEQSTKERLILQSAGLDFQQRVATMFARSGLFADVKGASETESIAKAMVKIQLGESMGFSAAESMTGIDLIQGRIAVGANLRAARMQRAGYSWPRMQCTDEGCYIPLEFQGKPMLHQRVDPEGNLVVDKDGNPVMVQAVVSFKKSDAEKAGLATKENYRKDPSSMYFARAITRAQRRYAPGVLGVDVLDTYEAREIPPESGWSESPAAPVVERPAPEKLADKIRAQQKRKEAAAEAGTRMAAEAAEQSGEVKSEQEDLF